MGLRRMVLLALALGACNAEKFVAPDKPDLYKVPYDFASGSAKQDLAINDLAVEDLSVTHLDDLAQHDKHD